MLICCLLFISYAETNCYVDKDLLEVNGFMDFDKRHQPLLRVNQVRTIFLQQNITP